VARSGEQLRAIHPNLFGLVGEHGDKDVEAIGPPTIGLVSNGARRVLHRLGGEVSENGQAFDFMVQIFESLIRIEFFKSLVRGTGGCLPRSSTAAAAPLAGRLWHRRHIGGILRSPHRSPSFNRAHSEGRA